MAKSNGRQRVNPPPRRPSKAKILEDRRRRAKIRLLIVASVVVVFGVFVFLAVRWGIEAYWRSQAQLMQYTVSDFLVTEPVRGLCLRDEYLNVAADSGLVSLKAPQGGYVEAGELVASFDTAQSAQSIEAQIVDIEARLESYDENKATELQLIDNRIIQDENAIRQKTVQLREAVRSFDSAAIKQLEEEIQGLNAVRLRHVSERLQMPDDPQTLEQRLASLRAQLENSHTDSYAPFSGIVSYWIDRSGAGYGLYDYSEISIDDFETEPLVVDLSASREVLAGGPLYKIVDPGPWRWTGLIPASVWQKPEDGLVSFLYSEFDETETGDESAAAADKLQPARVMRLESWLVDGPLLGEYHRVTVEFPEAVISTLKTRMLTLEYVEREAQGIILQRENLFEHEGRTGYLALQDGVAVFREANIADSDGDRILLADTMGPVEVITNPHARMIGLRMK